MNVSIPEGTFVVAVSGGVDSVALLNLLVAKNQEPRTKNYIVAHLDHGIRPDSHLDAELVRSIAAEYGVQFISEKAELGTHASEDSARNARYAFLRKVMQENHADAIITAHHQDDLIETIALHVMRGTGRRGLSPMLQTPDILRPLLGHSKQQIIEYAHSNNLSWNEDSTNESDDYVRNVIRKKLKSRMTQQAREKLLTLYEYAKIRNSEIDLYLEEVMQYVCDENGTLVRTRFVTLPYKVSLEIMMGFLKNYSINTFDRKKINALVIAAKTLQVGKKIDINNTHWLVSEKTSLKIVRK